MVENPQFVAYRKQDKLLHSWLLSTVNDDIQPHLIGTNIDFGLLNAKIRMFVACSYTNNSSLRHYLHSQDG